MFDVFFKYTDKDLSTWYNDIETIGQSNTTWAEFSGDELLKHRFNLNKDFYLYGKETSYIVSCANLISVEITQK